MSTRSTYESLQRIERIADLELTFIYPSAESRKGALEAIRKEAQAALKAAREVSSS